MWKIKAVILNRWGRGSGQKFSCNINDNKDHHPLVHICSMFTKDGSVHDARHS